MARRQLFDQCGVWSPYDPTIVPLGGALDVRQSIVKKLRIALDTARGATP